MKERCGRKWPQRSFWCSLGKMWRWDHKPKQLNNQQRGSHRRSGNAHSAREDLVETNCHGWGCKQSRPIPRAVRAATLCPRCPHRRGASCKYGGKEMLLPPLAFPEPERTNSPTVQISRRFRSANELSFRVRNFSNGWTGSVRNKNARDGELDLRFGCACGNRVC